ncbi:tektin-3-like [Argonauta hians]
MAPPYVRQSITVLPWRPATYYQASKINTSRPICKRVADPICCCSQIGKVDPVSLPGIFQSSRNALYTRYSDKEWAASNAANYNTSEYLRHGSERLRLNSLRTCKEIDDKTSRGQNDVGKKLAERINDTTFWKNELLIESDAMLDDMSALGEAKRLVEKALAESNNVLNITQECLYNREKRQSIDLVHDKAEKALIKEVETIRKCQEKFRNALEKANAQLNLNRAALHELERDTGAKFIANNLDESAFQMRSPSLGVNYHFGVEKIDNTVTNPETWSMITNNNIKRSQAERASSKHLRNEIDTALLNCCNEMWQQWNNANQALADRIQETLIARNKIQAHLSKVLQELFDMNKNIEFLKKSIQDKQNPLKVAQTRLNTRLRRPDIEACRDHAQVRLLEEVGEIYDSLELLKKRLNNAEDALQDLLRMKSTLEEDLSIKNNTLFLDREKCLAMRTTFPMSPISASHIRTSSNVLLNA